MEKLLTHTGEEYRRAAKALKLLLASGNERAGVSAGESPAEAALAAVILEALRFAAVRADNPPLTRAHLKQMHGQAVSLEVPALGCDATGGIVDCRDETLLILDHSGYYKAEWFHGTAGRYYRFPLNGVDLLTGWRNTGKE